MASKSIALFLCVIAFIFFLNLFGENGRKWDPDGYHVHSVWQKWSANEILNAFSFNGDEKVLDIGSGDGKVASLIASHVPNGHVVGINNSPEMNSFARKTYPESNITFEVANAQSLEFF